MKRKEYKDKEGNIKATFSLEDKDEITFKYDKLLDVGSYGTKGSNVLDKNGLEIFMTFTPGQAKQIEKEQKIKDKTFISYEYENKFGKFIGIKPKNK